MGKQLRETDRIRKEDEQTAKREGRMRKEDEQTTKRNRQEEKRR
jgi:hypothetical protein